MIVYHEADPDSVKELLRSGIRQGSSGEKTDGLIHKTDEYLDARIPGGLSAAGVSRCDNIYAFLEEDGLIRRITDGKNKNIRDFIDSSDQSVLALEIDPSKCYVSDLEAYDKVKKAMQDKADAQQIAGLAETYWSAVVPAGSYLKGSFRRPEVMITYDVGPEHLTVPADTDNF